MEEFLGHPKISILYQAYVLRIGEQLYALLMNLKTHSKVYIYILFVFHHENLRFFGVFIIPKRRRSVECVKFSAENDVLILFSNSAEDLNKDVVKLQSAQEQDDSFNKARRVRFCMKGKRLCSVVDHKRLRQTNSAFP